jgi:hypothetical protein
MFHPSSIGLGDVVSILPFIHFEENKTKLEQAIAFYLAGID